QLFGEIEQYFAEKPGTSMIVSPTWANGTIQVARFFLPDPMPIQLGSVEAHINRKEPLSSQILFVVTPREYEKVLDSGKFSGITVEKTLPYPDGSPGFYFIRLAYDENVDALFEQEAAERRTLLKGMIFLDGQPVQASYSRLDIGQIENLFDGDTRSLGRTEEANPAVIELVFPEPRELNSVAVMVGSMRARVTVRLFESEDAKPLVYSYTMPA
ncbi:MAG: hypothetical protein GY802_00565, partial [Gammaproteobacteria bacterium]|nr:hypothetical protein [Gammaproteobacteria bacterium]